LYASQFKKQLSHVTLLNICYLNTIQVTKQKLVNAKYCDKFPHVRWKDGQVVHVQVTPEVHRAYEQRMMLTMEAIQQR